MIRGGILGAANIAITQIIPALTRSSHASVVAIASESGKANQIAKSLNIPKFYDQYQALLEDPEIDAVYIPLPNHLHKKWVLLAAKQGKHILCEKPIALNYEEAETMIDTCNQHQVKLMEAFMYQFHPQHARVKEIIASGEIGNVQLMQASFSFTIDRSTTNIRLDPEKGGGSFYDVGSYCLHSAMHILDSTPKTMHVLSDIDEDKKVDITTVVLLELKNGVKVQMDSSFNMPLRNEYKIIGTKGTIDVPRAYRPDTYQDEGVVIVETEKERREEKIIGDQYKLEMDTMNVIIMNNKSLESYHNLTLANMKYMDEIYRSK